MKNGGSDGPPFLFGGIVARIKAESRDDEEWVFPVNDKPL